MNKLRQPYEYEDPRCAEVGTILFFASDMDDPDQKTAGEDTYKYARQICETCLHKAECAEWGIRYETYGMWGGMTPADRSRARKKLRIAVGEPLPLRIKR